MGQRNHHMANAPGAKAPSAAALAAPARNDLHPRSPAEKIGILASRRGSGTELEPNTISRDPTNGGTEWVADSTKTVFLRSRAVFPAGEHGKIIILDGGSVARPPGCASSQVGLTAVQRLHAGNLALHFVFRDQRVHLVQRVRWPRATGTGQTVPWT